MKGDQAIIYRDVVAADGSSTSWAIATDGLLVRVYPSGDDVYYQSDKNLLWTFEVGVDGGAPTGYYYFIGDGNYLFPQDGSYLTTMKRGVYLNGRRDDEYGSAIQAWDDSVSSWRGLRVDDGVLSSTDGNQAQEFVFARNATEDVLHTVATVPSVPGLTIQMFDYDNSGASWENTPQGQLLGSTRKEPAQGLVSNTLAADGFPTITGNEESQAGNSLGLLFSAAGNGYVTSNTTVTNTPFIQSTFDETGYYEYSSAQNYAYLNGNAFTVYQELGAPVYDPSTNNKTSYGHGNFFPYNAISAGQYSPNANYYDENNQELPATDPRFGEKLYRVGTEGDASSINYQYGMSMSASFYQLKDGKTAAGDPVTYYFNGDDDLWVYVDGVLILDIGGVHGAMSGSINFSTGEVVVAGQQTTIKALFEQAGKASSVQWKGNTFADYTSHDFKMFYMERGRGAANLHMRFNLPVIESGKFTVEKKLEDAYGNDTVQTAYANVRYTYKAYTVDGSGNSRVITTAPVYEVCATANKAKGDHVNIESDGTFSLRPGERVVFDVADNSTEYYVQETGVVGPSGMTLSDYDVYLNGNQKSNRETDKTTVANQSRVMVENRYKHPHALNITKQVPEGSGDPDDTFEFRVYLESANGELVPYAVGDYTVKNASGGVISTNRTGVGGSIAGIHAGETVCIEGLVAGTDFMVLEGDTARYYQQTDIQTTGAGAFDTALSGTANTLRKARNKEAAEVATGSITAGADAKVTITNERKLPDKTETKVGTADAQLNDEKSTASTKVYQDVKAGDELTYTISYHNATDSTANITITDELSQYVTFQRLEIKDDSGQTVTQDSSSVVPTEGQNGTITLNIKNVPRHTGGTVTLVTKVKDDVAFDIVAQGKKGVTKKAGEDQGEPDDNDQTTPFSATISNTAKVKVGNLPEVTTSTVENPITVNLHETGDAMELRASKIVLSASGQRQEVPTGNDAFTFDLFNWEGTATDSLAAEPAKGEGSDPEVGNISTTLRFNGAGVAESWDTYIYFLAEHRTKPTDDFEYDRTVYYITVQGVRNPQTLSNGGMTVESTGNIGHIRIVRRIEGDNRFTYDDKGTATFLDHIHGTDDADSDARWQYWQKGSHIWSTYYNDYLDMHVGDPNIVVVLDYDPANPQNTIVNDVQVGQTVDIAKYVSFTEGNKYLNLDDFMKEQGLDATFTNRYTKETSVSVKKEWLDGGATTHPSVTFDLYKNGTKMEGKSIQLDGKVDGAASSPTRESAAWTATWTGLDYAEDYVPIVYTVKEQALSGYETTYPNGGDSAKDGETITNRLSGTTAFYGKKVWDNTGSTERPLDSSLTLTLIRRSVKSGSQAETLTLQPTWGTEGDADKFSFANLPAYDSEGYAYTYSVIESPVTGYTTTYGGESGKDVNNRLTITNTFDPNKRLTIQGTKTWLDGGKTHNNANDVQLKLYRAIEGGTRVEVPNTELTWNGSVYTFTNKEHNTDGKFPAIDNRGRDYTYTVVEEPIAGYNTTYSGYNITNAIEQEHTKVEGTKRWVAPAGKAKPTVTVTLYRDGTATNQTTTITSGGTSYSFTNLPFYDLPGSDDGSNANDGHKFTYTVRESLPAGEENKWTQSQSGNNFTNSINQELVDVKVNKTWIAPKGESYPALTLTLYRDGEDINKRITLGGGTLEDAIQKELSDEKTWANLPKYDLIGNADGSSKDDGHEFVYTVQEAAPAGWIAMSSVADTAASGNTHASRTFSFTNKHQNNYVTSLSGPKRWVVPVGTAVPNATFQLQRQVTKSDGTIETAYADVQDVSGISQGSQTGKNGFSFTNLPLYNDDFTKTYSYRVVEKPVPSDYTVSYLNASGNAKATGEQFALNGETIVNTIRQQKISVKASKKWTAPAGTAKPRVTIHLLRDGKQMNPDVKWEIAGGTFNTETNTETHDFTNLDKYDLTDGHEYVYTVSEDPIGTAGWVQLANGMEVTNTYSNPERAQVSGTKTWIAPATIDKPTVTFQLYQTPAGGSRTLYKTQSGAGLTSYSFTDLPKDDGKGHNYTYDVEEVLSAADQAKWTSTKNGNNFTNVIKQETTRLSGSKTWVAPAGTVTPELTITLLRDGKPTTTKTTVQESSITAGSNSLVLGYAFESLPKYDLPDTNDGSSLDDGHEFVYSAQETPVEGWTGKQEGNHFTNTLVNTEKVSLTGTKTWVGPENLIPTNGATFTLQRSVKNANGTTTDFADYPTSSPSTATSKTGYSFTNLPRYNADYSETYTYRVVESLSGTNAEKWNVSSPDASGNFRNVIKQENVTVQGNKAWVAPNDAANPTATIDLYRDNATTPIQSTTITGGGTTYSFTGLPRYDLTDGHEYTYTVRERPIAGWTSTQDGNNFTNTMDMPTTELSGTKTWIGPASLIPTNGATFTLQRKVKGTDDNTYSPVDDVPE